ncbi:MAG: hypothetical protein EOO92_11340, partial [Pedobacter sp.]
MLKPVSAIAQEDLQLLDALKRRGVPVTLMLHPNAAHASPMFAGFVDKVEPATNFQDVLVASRALVTDFSSVAFEAVLLGKHVAFFATPEIEASTRKSYVQYPDEFPPHLSSH